MPNSHIPAGSDKAMRMLGAGMFTQTLRENSTLGKLCGKMPTNEAQLANVIERQTSSDMPIVRSADTERGKGSDVEILFLQPHKARPIMGDRVAEGRGDGLTYVKDRVSVNQARFPVKIGSKMTGLRSAIDFAKVARPTAQTHAGAYLDQCILVHLAGARGFEDNVNWRLPLANDPEFAEALVSPVLAPTKNRHFMSDGNNGIVPFAQTAGQADIASSDTLNMTTVDSVRAMVESMALPPHAVRVPGDTMAGDSPLRVLLVSAAQYSEFAADGDFRKFQVDAMNRSKAANDHPMFCGEVGLWNGVLLMKMPHPIRFYAGDPIRYSLDYQTESEDEAIVNPNFGKTHAVDRALLLGGQALAQVFAASNAAHGGMPMFFKHVSFDYDDKAEVMVGLISGSKKIRWKIDHGGGNERWTDHGVIAIDTAVKIPPGEL